MSHKGRMDYILLVRNAVEVCQFELKKYKARLEKQNELYISAMIEHDIAVKLYEKRIATIREICASHGLSDAEIDALTKWRED